MMTRKDVANGDEVTVISRMMMIDDDPSLYYLEGVAGLKEEFSGSSNRSLGLIVQ